MQQIGHLAPNGSRSKGHLDTRLPVKRPPTKGHRQKATGQKATASKGVFSGAYLNTFVKLTGIRKNIHIFIHQKVYTNNISGAGGQCKDATFAGIDADGSACILHTSTESGGLGRTKSRTGLPT